MKPITTNNLAKKGVLKVNMGQIETFRQFLKQRNFLFEKCARCSRLRRVISQQPTEVKRQVSPFSKQDNKHPQYQGNLLEGTGRGWIISAAKK